MGRMTTGPVGRLQDGGHMTTGPVGRFPLDPGGRMTTGPVGWFPGGSPSGGANNSIQASPGDRFTWATVTNPDPLTIQLDGPGTQDLPLVPETLIPPSALLPYTRVWVQLHSTAQAQRVIILGLAAGRNAWVDVTIQPGFGVRDGNSAFQPQVFLDASGLVHFQGQMAPTGLSGISADIQIMQLPDGYAPAAQQWWIGYPAHNPSKPYGGYFHTDGAVYFRYDANNAPSSTDYFPIIIPPWVPTPAQPY